MPLTYCLWALLGNGKNYLNLKSPLENFVRAKSIKIYINNVPLYLSVGMLGEGKNY